MEFTVLTIADASALGRRFHDGERDMPKLRELVFRQALWLQALEEFCQLVMSDDPEVIEYVVRLMHGGNSPERARGQSLSFLSDFRDSHEGLDLVLKLEPTFRLLERLGDSLPPSLLNSVGLSRARDQYEATILNVLGGDPTVGWGFWQTQHGQLCEAIGRVVDFLVFHYNPDRSATLRQSSEDGLVVVDTVGELIVDGNDSRSLSEFFYQGILDARFSANYRAMLEVERPEREAAFRRALEAYPE